MKAHLKEETEELKKKKERKMKMDDTDLHYKNITTHNKATILKEHCI